VIRTLRSIVDPAALAGLVADAYRLPVTACVLLRSLVNDVYRVDTGDRSRVLKLYRAGHRTRAEAAWEVDLSRALGGVVARGIPLADGAPAGVLAAAEGERPYTLWEWAPGARPPPPWDDRLFRRYGAATARFHAAGDGAGAPPRGFVVQVQSLKKK
jgi:Ser/Thr protein kinase RdoA (MazF antagonist)